MNKEPKYLPIINKKDSCKIKVKDICYVYRENRKLIFKIKDDSKETYGDMNKLAEYLGSDFLRCMSGCIINITKVKGIEDGMVYFDDGSSLHIGCKGFTRVKQKFNTYWRNMVPWDEPDSDDADKDYDEDADKDAEGKKDQGE